MKNSTRITALNNNATKVTYGSCGIRIDAYLYVNKTFAEVYNELDTPNSKYQLRRNSKGNPYMHFSRTIPYEFLGRHWTVEQASNDVFAELKNFTCCKINRFKQEVQERMWKNKFKSYIPKEELELPF